MYSSAGLGQSPIDMSQEGLCQVPSSRRGAQRALPHGPDVTKVLGWQSWEGPGDPSPSPVSTSEPCLTQFPLHETRVMPEDPPVLTTQHHGAVDDIGAYFWGPGPSCIARSFLNPSPHTWTRIGVLSVFITHYSLSPEAIPAPLLTAVWLWASALPSLSLSPQCPE